MLNVSLTRVCNHSDTWESQKRVEEFINAEEFQFYSLCLRGLTYEFINDKIMG